MNRFEFAECSLLPHETSIRRDIPVRLYDGDVKTDYEGGELILTNYRIFWVKPGDFAPGNTCLCLSLSYIVFVEVENPGPFSFGRSKKVILHLKGPIPGKMPGPIDMSSASYIKLSFKEGLDPAFMIDLENALGARQWELLPQPQIQGTSNTSQHTKVPPPIKTRKGIVGIERSLQEKHKATDDSISMAFQDLTKLMQMAKNMVTISKNISAKIRERTGDITEDETVRFKAYLMSMGIEDPVTRDSYKSSNEYFRQLAMQLAQILEEPVKEVGGMMALTDVFCRVNRARGMQLLSPEDLLNASRLLGPLGLPIVLRIFDSGVMVIQARSLDDSTVVEAISEWLKERGSATAEELAQSEGISVLLARERLFVTEKNGKACRDDTIEALRFYPNLFLEQNA